MFGWLLQLATGRLLLDFRRKQRALLKEVLLANSSEMINPVESRLPVLC